MQQLGWKLRFNVGLQLILLIYVRSSVSQLWGSWKPNCGYQGEDDCGYNRKQQNEGNWTVVSCRTSLEVQNHVISLPYDIYYKEEEDDIQNSTSTKKMQCYSRKCRIYDLQRNKSYSVCTHNFKSNTTRSCIEVNTTAFGAADLKIRNLVLLQTSNPSAVTATWNSPILNEYESVQIGVECIADRNVGNDNSSAVNGIRNMSCVGRTWQADTSVSFRIEGEIGEKASVKICITSSVEAIQLENQKECCTLELNSGAPVLENIKLREVGNKIELQCEDDFCKSYKHPGGRRSRYGHSISYGEGSPWYDTNMYGHGFRNGKYLAYEITRVTAAYCKTNYNRLRGQLAAVRTFPVEIPKGFYVGNTITVRIFWIKEDHTEIFVGVTNSFFVEPKNIELRTEEKTTSITFKWTRNEYDWKATTFSVVELKDNGNRSVSKKDYFGCNIQIEMKNLEPFTNYTWNVSQEIDNQRRQVVKKIRTRPLVCKHVTEIKWNSENVRPSFSWQAPTNNIGTVEYYSVQLNTKTTQQEMSSIPKKDCDEYSCTFQSRVVLQPDTSYTFTVSCRNEYTDKNGPVETLSLKTNATVPVLDAIKLTVDHAKGCIGCGSKILINIKYQKSFAKPGQYMKLEVLYAPQGSLGESIKKEIKYGNGQEDRQQDEISVKIEARQSSIILEDLKGRMTYNAKIRYHTKVGYGDSQIVTFRTAGTLDNFTVLIALIIISFIIILLLVFLVLPPITSRIYASPPIRMRKEWFSGLKRLHSIPIEDLINNLQHLLSNKKTLLKQFLELRKISPTFSNDKINGDLIQIKNRYQDIIPFNHSRVVLKEMPGDVNSHYINASYIDSYKRKLQFIATQGPMKTTSRDFWRMIWQKNVSSIIMLSSTIENGRDKCFMYWPNSSGNVSNHPRENLQVKLLSSECKDGYTKRNIILSKGKRQREIEHFQYTSWPDMSCPQNPQEILNFMTHVKESFEAHGKSNHIVVHCSAGVGRTGTFIELHNLMDEIAQPQSNTIDIFLDLLLMRCLRANMVQTLDQYVMIHKLLLLYCAWEKKKSGGISEAEYKTVLASVSNYMETPRVATRIWLPDEDTEMILFTDDELDAESGIAPPARAKENVYSMSPE